MKIHTFNSAQETASAVTHELIRQLDTVRKTNFNLAISGGTTPGEVFRLWAESYSKSIPWYRVHLYWVDERCVAPSDSSSNFGLAKRLFLDKVKIPRTQIHRIMGETDPVTEAKRYSELVMKNLPLYDGVPQFDMLLLGVGKDGHTSSLFPGNAGQLTTHHPYITTVNPDNGQARIALTGQPMLRAGITLFHVTGKDKADILTEITDPKIPAEAYPAGYVAQKGDNVQFFIDSAAGSKLGL